MTSLSRKELAAYFDHTLLKAETVSDDIARLCDEADEYGFASVCLNPRWVDFAADRLNQSPVKVCTVAGFPFGADTPRSKAEQTRIAINDGADEIDIVADLASVIERDEKYYLHDLETVLDECRKVRPVVPLKVIIESAALTLEQKQFACAGCSRVGVDFVKTSTGLHPAGGATVEDVALMARFAPRCKIKAAGGIRTFDEALVMIEAGASRIGASASVKIMQEYIGRNPQT